MILHIYYNLLFRQSVLTFISRKANALNRQHLELRRSGWSAVSPNRSAAVFKLEQT